MNLKTPYRLIWNVFIVLSLCYGFFNIELKMPQRNIP